MANGQNNDSEPKNGKQEEDKLENDTPRYEAIENLWKPKEWSIMVYLAGGRDISDEARESLMRMKQVGSTKNIHLVAQFDSGSEGTVTKRYYLTPSPNTIQILMLLEQACTEVPNALEPYDDATWMYYYNCLSRTFSPSQKKLLEFIKHDEMKKLLIASPEHFKNFVLNCILDEDVYPRSSGIVGDTNAGDPRVLVDFIRWAKVRYPAKRYMVVLWGHGSGLSVAKDFPSWPNVGNGDSLTAHELLKAFKDATQGSIEEFKNDFVEEIIDLIKEEKEKYEKNGGDARVLKGKIYQDKWIKDKVAGNKEIKPFLKKYLDFEKSEKFSYAYKHGVDIVGFNSCSLATIEIYRQLSGIVGLVIASEGFTPKTSWPYDRILKALDAESSHREPKDLAKIIVDEYIRYYKEPIKTAGKLKQLQRSAKELGIDWHPIYGYNLQYKGPGMQYKGPGMQYKGPGMQYKGPGMQYKGPGMQYKGPGMQYKGPGMSSDAELLLEIGGVDLFVCDPKKSKMVAICMKILVEKLKRLPKRGIRPKVVFGALLGAHAISQSYFNGNFMDLHDFCRALKTFCPNDKGEKDYFVKKSIFNKNFRALDDDQSYISSLVVYRARTNTLLSKIFEIEDDKLETISIRSVCDWVMKAIEGINPIKNERNANDEEIINSCGDDVRNSNGVSIFFPWGRWAETDFAVPYEKLEFLKETEWHVFLNQYRELAKNFEEKERIF